jgi:hypothetical protein
MQTGRDTLVHIGGNRPIDLGRKKDRQHHQDGDRMDHEKSRIKHDRARQGAPVHIVVPDDLDHPGRNRQQRHDHQSCRGRTHQRQAGDQVAYQDGGQEQTQHQPAAGIDHRAIQVRLRGRDHDRPQAAQDNVEDPGQHEHGDQDFPAQLEGAMKAVADQLRAVRGEKRGEIVLMIRQIVPETSRAGARHRRNLRAQDESRSGESQQAEKQTFGPAPVTRPAHRGKGGWKHGQEQQQT